MPQVASEAGHDPLSGRRARRTRRTRRSVRPRHPGRPPAMGPCRRRLGADKVFGASFPTGRWDRTRSRSTTGAVLSPPGIATLIADFISALGLSDVTLVGNDTGGGLCQFVVDAHPDAVGRLVLTNCDAFDKFPPFPFTLVFALLRGSVVDQDAVRADEADGAASLAARIRTPDDRPRPEAHEQLARAVPLGRTNPHRPRHPAEECRQDRPDGCVDTVPALHETRRSGVGSARPMLQAVTRQENGRAVPKLLADRGARRQDVCVPG